MTDDWARPVVHWEIQARDPERIRDFYGRMFNWEIGEGQVKRIPVGVGPPEPGPAGQIRAGDTSRVVLYIQVRNLQESLDRAKEFGGAVIRAPFDIPGGPTLAGISDPEGNPVTLVQQ
jgi:hypothetical protein